MIKNMLGIFAVLSLSFWVSTANATFTFSNVSYTADSVTFTIDGDMTGYATPGAGLNNFSLAFTVSGDIWNGTNTFDPNTWSRSVFDNKTLFLNGGTGIWYTWSGYTSALADAAVSSATVTVSFSQPNLNVLAVSPSISFYWGTSNISSTLLGTVIPTSGNPPTTYTVGGNITGLTGSVTIQNNSSNDIIETANAGFTFPAQAEGTDYVVTVSSQPAGQTCTVGNGSGTNITVDITNVTVTCADDVTPTPAPLNSGLNIVIIKAALDAKAGADE
jgi:hypothetical protein